MGKAELMDAMSKGYLIVDDRENDKVIHKLIMSLGDAKIKGEGGKVMVMRLKTGDYIIGDWIIEAKEIKDLSASIIGQGRTRTIAAQLRDQQIFGLQYFKTPYLVVYGETKDLKPFFHKGSKGGKQNAVIQKARMKARIAGFKKGFLFRFPATRYFEVESLNDFVAWIIETYTQKVILPQEVSSE
jgi:ERCC4-type nuclease|tara:strand:+ start:876 stop:1430 length:555 start_codon:yes stop_codon:yes gene_type:complete